MTLGKKVVDWLREQRELNGTERCYGLAEIAKAVDCTEKELLDDSTDSGVLRLLRENGHVEPVVMPIDFSCKVCGVQCAVAPDPPERAVCEDHCENHEYEYDLWRRDRFCKKCDKQIDPDWYVND